MIKTDKPISPWSSGNVSKHEFLAWNPVKGNPVKGKKKLKKGRDKSNLVYSKDFTYYKYHKIKEPGKRSFTSKRNNSIEVIDIFDFFCDDAKEIKLIMKIRKKTSKKEKLWFINYI